MFIYMCAEQGVSARLQPSTPNGGSAGRFGETSVIVLAYHPTAAGRKRLLREDVLHEGLPPARFDRAAAA